MYLDIASPLPQAIRLAADLVGVERLPFSSDHPWVSPKLILDSLRGAGLSAESEAKILCQNAREVFRLGELGR